MRRRCRRSADQLAARYHAIAEAILFLAAPENAYVTGHLMMVDGGWTAGFMG